MSEEETNQMLGGDLPRGWALVSMQDVAAWGSGGTPSRKNAAYYGGSIPWIKTGELDAGVILDTEEKLTEEGLKNSSAKVFPKGSVAVAMYGATIGKASILGIPAATNQACAVGVPNKSLTSAQYLFHYLRSQKEAFIAAGKGGAQPNISQGVIKEWPLPLAPLAEQKRIADKLEAVLERVDGCRTRLDRIPDLLKRFRQSVLAAATSGKLTEDWIEKGRDDDWQNVTLEMVAKDFSYGSSAKSSPSGEVPVLRMGNIQDGRLDWEGLVYTSDKAEIAKYRLTEGDVLFNRTNSPELVGKTCVFDGKHEAIYAGYLIRIRCSPSLLPYYLNYCLNSPAGRDYCWQVKSDGVSQSNINAKKLAAFTFLLPSVCEQTEIVRRVESLFAFADQVEARLTEARSYVERLTPATLAKAFRGELTPQDPNDEPARVMLERLKNEPAPQMQKLPQRKKARPFAMITLSLEVLKKTILTLPQDQFTFAELRDKVPGDFDTLSDLLFTLLAEKTPVIKQVFDKKSKVMQFQRLKP